MAFRKKEVDLLDAAINDVLVRMRKIGPDEDEYRRLVVYLDRLMEMQRNKKPRFTVSPDTVAIILGNVAIALIVTQYERADVIATKAKDFLMTKKL